MLNYFVVNALMLIGMISIAYLSYSYKRDLFVKYSMLARILFGIYAGISGILLMNQSFETSNGVYLAYRNYNIGISAIYGGFIPALIASIIMFVYRFLSVGFNQTVITLFIGLTLQTIGAVIISKYINKFNNKWTSFCIWSITINSIALYTLLNGENISLRIFAYYYIGYALLSIIIYIILKNYNELEKSYIKLSEESTTDFLTGLNNKRGFTMAFESAINWSTRKNEKLSFMMIDIDHFKKVNDTHGHPAGDEILRQLAFILTENARSFDVVSRNGGEEFSIILPDCSSSQAYEVGERIRKTVENNDFNFGRKKVKITISIGIASYPEHLSFPSELLVLADQSMFEAKQTGRNKAVVYTNSMKQ